MYYVGEDYKVQISYNGVQFLKEREGFRSEAYKDTGGVWTIGYGTIAIKGKPVEAGQTISKKEAEICLVEDLAWAQTTVNKSVRVPLRQGMYDALVSFVYNIGETQWADSTLLKVLNAGQYDKVSEQLLRWKYDNGKEIPGLLRRRELERDMFYS